MRKSLLMRLSIFALCAMLVFSLACPAFAVDEIYPNEGHIYVGSFTFSKEDFSRESELYYVRGFSAGGLKVEYVESCVVRLGTEVFHLEWFNFLGDSGNTMLGLGNPSLIDDGLADNGCDFVFVVCKRDKSLNYLACTADFYDDQISELSADGLTMSISVPSAYVEAVMDDTGNVFTAAIGMVGTVASTVARYPILFLPIVIGLCGIGVAFFRRIKQ